ncbi:MAG: nucleotidyltransferase family protein [Pyrinomonadaceae bacterium]
MIVQNKKQIFGLVSEHREALSGLGVHRVGLFGSFVKDQTDEESDVDLLVEFRPGEKSFDNFMELSFLFEDIFGRKVDLLTPESLSPYLGPKIMAEVEYGVVD